VCTEETRKGTRISEVFAAAGVEQINDGLLRFDSDTYTLLYILGPNRTDPSYPGAS